MALPHPPRPGVSRRLRRGDTLTDQRLSDQSVALIVKRRARTAGVPAAELSGHSLRAGYATAAAAAGVEERIEAQPQSAQTISKFDINLRWILLL
jgi:integrase